MFQYVYGNKSIVPRFKKDNINVEDCTNLLLEPVSSLKDISMYEGILSEEETCVYSLDGQFWLVTQTAYKSLLPEDKPKEVTDEDDWNIIEEYVVYTPKFESVQSNPRLGIAEISFS
jgi:hypothetical protein